MYLVQQKFIITNYVKYVQQHSDINYPAKMKIKTKIIQILNLNGYNIPIIYKKTIQKIYHTFESSNHFCVIHEQTHNKSRHQIVLKHNAYLQITCWKKNISIYFVINPLSKWYWSYLQIPSELHLG